MAYRGPLVDRQVKREENDVTAAHNRQCRIDAARAHCTLRKLHRPKSGSYTWTGRGKLAAGAPNAIECCDRTAALVGRP